jgi:hypothetical protein
MVTGTAGQRGPPRIVRWAWVLSEVDTMKAKGERKSARRKMVKLVVKITLNALRNWNALWLFI